MNKFFLLLLLFPVICVAQNNIKPFIHYNIYATLNSGDKTVTGFEKITYKNAGDTAQTFLWIRLYPNAYANDRTAYSDYMINQGDLRFYFSKEDEKGFINQLYFKQNDVALNTAFDSTKNDAIKVYLQNSLQPGDSAEITTPFYVKVPYDFTGFGYNEDGTIVLRHWFPQIAYHDEKGWDLSPFISYEKLKNNIAAFDVKIISDKDNFQSNAVVLSKTKEQNKTIINYYTANADDFNMSNALNSVVCCDASSTTEDNFNKLIPNIFSGKRPANPQATEYLINQKIRGVDPTLPKSLNPTFLFNLKETDKYNYLSFLPAVGFNDYDKAMVGIMIHNYQLPLNKFNFLFAPMYATNSKTLAGVGSVAYNIWHKNGDWWRFAVSGERFSIAESNLNVPNPLFLQVNRFVPGIFYTKYFGENAPYKKWSFGLKSFILNRNYFDYSRMNDTTYLPVKKANTNVLFEFQTTLQNNRALYPYSLSLKADGYSDFLRLGLTGNYFLNYDASGKGVNTRFFAGKFFYLKSSAQYGVENFNLSPYLLTLSAPNGAQDFTYSDYFIGRNEYTGWMSQQIMQRDGFFKVSMPMSTNPVGVSDNWIAALNFTADIPDKFNPLSVLPFKMPLRVFFDLGTYSGAWTGVDNAPSGKYVYDAGLQLSVWRDAVTVYFPLLYSRVFRDAYKSAYPVKTFVHTISFSVNLGKLKPRVLNHILPL